MKEDIMRQAIGDVDVKFIEEAEKEPEAKRPRTAWVKFGAIAAAVVLVAALAAAVLPGMLRGGGQPTPGAVPPAEDESVPSTEADTADTGEDPGVIDIEGCQPYPDINLLFNSLIEEEGSIVKGKILYKIDERHSNPDLDLVNAFGETVPLGILTRYAMLVTDSYCGEIAPGETVVIDTFLITGVGPDATDEVIIDPEPEPVEFPDEQEVLLFLEEDKYYVAPSEEKSYTLLYGNWSIFSVEDNGKFRSPVFEIDEEIINEYIGK